MFQFFESFSVQSPVARARLVNPIANINGIRIVCVFANSFGEIFTVEYVFTFPQQPNDWKTIASFAHVSAPNTFSLSRHSNRLYYYYSKVATMVRLMI